MRRSRLAALLVPLFAVSGMGLRDLSAAEPSLGGRALIPTCCGADPATLLRSQHSLVAFLFSGEPLAVEAGEADAGRARTPGAERARTVDATLREWAQCSARLEPMTPARLRRLMFDYRGSHSGHEIDVLTMLQRPVTDEELAARFEWSLQSQSEGAAVLTAVPRDAAEKLFVPQIEVTISRRNGLPEAARFENRGAARLAVALDEHRFVRSVDERPVILQTAALRTEKPVSRTVPNVLTSVQRQASELIARGNPGEAASEVEQILRHWEQASTLRGPTELRFHRFAYDLVFNVERRAAGRAVFADSTLARVDIEPREVPAGGASPRRDAAGMTFRVENARPEFWIWNGRQVTHASPAEMTWWEWKLPEKAEARPFWLWGDFRLEAALPFLHPVSAADLLQRFDVTLAQRYASTVHLTLKPRFKADKDHAREHEVILSATTLLPEAVRTVDPSGNVETVFVVTQRNLGVAVSKDLFTPRWDGWKKDR